MDIYGMQKKKKSRTVTFSRTVMFILPRQRRPVGQPSAIVLAIQKPWRARLLANRWGGLVRDLHLEMLRKEKLRRARLRRSSRTGTLPGKPPCPAPSGASDLGRTSAAISIQRAWRAFKYDNCRVANRWGRLANQACWSLLILVPIRRQRAYRLMQLVAWQQRQRLLEELGIFMGLSVGSFRMLLGATGNFQRGTGRRAGGFYRFLEEASGDGKGTSKGFCELLEASGGFQPQGLTWEAAGAFRGAGRFWEASGPFWRLLGGLGSFWEVTGCLGFLGSF